MVVLLKLSVEASVTAEEDSVLDVHTLVVEVLKVEVLDDVSEE